MHFKEELQFIIDICKQGVFTPCIPSSLLIKLLFLARFEKGRPLVDIVYDFVELGFNPFKHSGDPLLRTCLLNVVMICDKEVSFLKTRHGYNKKKLKKGGVYK